MASLVGISKERDQAQANKNIRNESRSDHGESPSIANLESHDDLMNNESRGCDSTLLSSSSSHRCLKVESGFANELRPTTPLLSFKLLGSILKRKISSNPEASFTSTVKGMHPSSPAKSYSWIA
jgi:hypothetical protein